MSTASLWSIGLGQTFLDAGNWEAPLMLPFESYREVLNEHARGHHVVGSAWFLVVAIMVFLVVFA